MDMAIIADDLSGANDTAIVFRKQGIKSCVINYPEGLDYQLKDCELLSVSTNTRDLGQEAAVLAVKNTAEALKSKGVRRIYKKIDSTWRGNIGAEIESIMDVMEFDIAIICSSFPKVQRTVKDGHLYIGHQRIEHTPIAFDPSKPVQTSYLPDILKSQTTASIHLITHEEVAKGKEFLTQRIAEMSNKNKTMIIIDAVSERDLDTVASIDTGKLEKLMFCGSAGLPVSMLKQENYLMKQKVLPVLTIVGSVHPVNKELVEVASDNKLAKAVLVDPCVLLEGRVPSKTKKEAVEILSDGNNLILHTGQSPQEREKTRLHGKTMKMQENEISNRINSQLQILADELLNQFELSGVIVTGGSTALHFLRGVKGVGIKLIDELETGVPYGTIIGGPKDGLKIITKAGGFGTPEVFIKGICLLQEIK